jgi:RNA polymerase sigma-70 factor, ECF subfamily
VTPASSSPRRQKKHARARGHETRALTRHIDCLYRAAWAMGGSRQDAEDLSREAFAQVLCSRRPARRGDELDELFHALRDALRASRRKARRRVASTTTSGSAVTDDPGSATGPQRGAGIREVYASVADLPENMREALVAVDVLGFTHQRAGRALGVSEETVATRLVRARTRLAADLRPAAVARRGTLPRLVADGATDVESPR